MKLVRNDAWKAEDDEILTSIVLSHIKRKSTQLAAFEEVAERLSRTSAACGFRWNSVVRHRHEMEINNAKEQRVKITKQNQTPINRVNISSHIHPLDSIVEQISSFKKTFDNMEKQIRKLKIEIEQKDLIIENLNRNQSTKSPSDNMTDDYVNLLQILNRARELGAFSNN